MEEDKKWDDWQGRAVRPVFRNKEVGPVNGDARMQFDTASPFLTLLNPVIRHGTLHVAGNMNNMLAFDNLMAMGGARYRTRGLGTAEVVEVIEEAEPDADGERRPVATRVSVREGEDPLRWRVTETLYDLTNDGRNAAVQVREAVYSRAGAEWEAEVR